MSQPHEHEQSCGLPAAERVRPGILGALSSQPSPPFVTLCSLLEVILPWLRGTDVHRRHAPSTYRRRSSTAPTRTCPSLTKLDNFNTVCVILPVPELQVLVYCHLSGRWVRVREFGPDEIIHDKDVENANGTDAPSKKSRPGRPAAADKPKRGREPAHESQPLRGPSACLVRTVPPGERPGKGGAAAATLAAAGQGQEKNETAGHAREKQDRADESGGWAGGTPVSARFMNRKVKTPRKTTLLNIRSIYIYIYCNREYIASRVGAAVKIHVGGETAKSPLWS